MSKPEAYYMWGNVENNIQIIESPIYLINRKTDVHDPKFCSQDNDGCSQKSSHIIGEFVLMKEQNCIQSVFKCPNINTLMNGFPNFKDIHIQGRISRRHFHHFKMNFYLHQKISP